MFIVVSCGGKNPEEKRGTFHVPLIQDNEVFDSIDLSKLYKKSEEVYRLQHGKIPYADEPLFFDTTINESRIQVLLRNDDQTIVRRRYDKISSVYMDTEMVLNLTKKGKIIHAQKKMKQRDFSEFIHESDFEKYSIERFSFVESTLTGISLRVLICQPDPDICFRILLVVKYDGTIEFVDLEEESG